MATKIVTKNSSTASAVPTASDLVQGELAVNVADKRLFTEDNGGSIIELGTNPSTLTVDTDTLAVDSTNNRVGIGTTSPEAKLHISTGGGITPFASSQIVSESSGNNYIELNGGSTSTTALYFGDSADQDVGGVLYNHSNNSMSFRANAASRVTIDSSGQVGIGTSSPASNLHINSADTSAGLQITNSATGSAETDGFHITVGSGGFTSLSAKETTGMAFLTGGTERARFSSGGQFTIGRTATGILAEEAGFMLKPDGLLLTAKDGTAEQTHVEFVNNAAVTAARVGTIKTSGSTTSYNTSSDYRLKTDAQPMTGATDRLKALNPVNFQWILDGTRVDGFLAHEVADVVPEAISGDKDAVDEDGNPDYQGIDQSKLVPLLVATIQELEARITQLENN